MGRIRTKTGSTSFAAYQFKRAILEQALLDSYTTEDRGRALSYFGGCAYCGSAEAPRNDHLVPVVKFGDFVQGNVVPACQKCDDSKGDRDVGEWMRKGTSPGSLLSRGMTKTEIETRLKRIEMFTKGYSPSSENELFGPYWERYQQVLRKINQLRQEAQDLVKAVKRDNEVINPVADVGGTTMGTGKPPVVVGEFGTGGVKNGRGHIVL